MAFCKGHLSHPSSPKNTKLFDQLSSVNFNFVFFISFDYHCLARQCVSFPKFAENSLSFCFLLSYLVCIIYSNTKMKIRDYSIHAMFLLNWPSFQKHWTSSSAWVFYSPQCLPVPSKGLGINIFLHTHYPCTTHRVDSLELSWSSYILSSTILRNKMSSFHNNVYFSLKWLNLINLITLLSAWYSHAQYLLLKILISFGSPTPNKQDYNKREFISVIAHIYLLSG